jgi:thioredoxin reductase (NADPH)
MRKVRVLIIGSGPAGLTAAIYTARAQFSTVVVTGTQLGGQIATTHDVDNFPGFPDGITGPELADRIKTQAERFGAEFDYDMVTAMDFTKGSPFYVKTQNTEYLADAVIVTIGATPRKLHIPGEDQYIGRGVSWCATCDGFFFRGKEIIVVGGGDSALQEAGFLTKFANSVTIVHRRDTLRASVALQTRIADNPRVKIIYDTVVDEIKGADGKVTNVTLRNVKSGATEDKPIDGVFIFVGYDPNSGIFAGQLKTDDLGYLIVDDFMRTNVEGVFAGGEIHDNYFRQAITASGQGAAAALSAVNWLSERERHLQDLSESAPAVPTSGG